MQLIIDSSLNCSYHSSLSDILSIRMGLKLGESLIIISTAYWLNLHHSEIRRYYKSAKIIKWLLLQQSDLSKKFHNGAI